jgi:hypothetical protein
MANDRSIPRDGGEAEPIPPRRPQAPSRARRWPRIHPTLCDSDSRDMKSSLQSLSAWGSASTVQ